MRPVLTVPGGMNNPVVHRLGILAEQRDLNSVMLRKDGSIALAVSGRAPQSGRGGGTTLTNVVEFHDEQFVSEALG